MWRNGGASDGEAIPDGRSYKFKRAIDRKGVYRVRETVGWVNLLINK